MERKILLLLSHKCLQELYNIMYSKQDTRQVFKETAKMKKQNVLLGSFSNGRCTIMH